MKFNEKLTLLRKKKGLSQEEFSYEMGVSRQSVFKWESGDNTPDIEKIKKISKFFNISLDRLLDDDIDIEDEPGEITERRVKKKVDPFEMSSPKKRSKAMLVVGIVLIPTSFILTIATYFLFENLILRYLAMGTMALGIFVGIILLVIRNLFKNDCITINQDGVFGCSFGKSFSFTYEEIEYAKLYNQSFNNIGIKTVNRSQDTVVFGVLNAEAIVRKINEIVSGGDI